MRYLRRWAVYLALMMTVVVFVDACATGGGSAPSVSDSVADDVTGGDDAAADDDVGGANATSPGAPAEANDAATEDTPADNGESLDSESPAADQLQSEPDSGTEAFALAQEGDPPGQVPTALTPADIGRAIVFRAEMAVEVADVAAASAVASQRIQGLGGLVFGQVTTTDPEPRTVLTFKVLPADFDTALGELAGVGTVISQSISADDVTERVVDLESRIATSAASVLRLRDLLDDARDANIIAQLENQLLDRETVLEQLRGQLRTVQEQVALATITVTITQSATVVPPAGVVVDAWLGVDDDDACPGSSELAIEEQDPAVLCVEIENVGEATLGAVEIDSEGLRLRTGDFTIVDGDPEALAPGERLVATLRLDVEDGRVRRREVGGGLHVDIVVSAAPAGPTLGAPVEDRSEVVLIVETADDALPGFGDALGGGVDALQLVVGVVMIGVGVVLPFVPFLLIIIGGLWIWRRRRTGGGSLRGAVESY